MPIRKRNQFIPRNQCLQLSGTLIKKMDAGKTDYLVKDETNKRLQLKVTPKGNKSFVVRYRNLEGIERKYKLGNFPDMNVTVARQRAAEILLNVATGGDPANEKSEKRRGQTFEQYSSQFMTDYAEIHLREKTQYDYRRLLEKVLNPALGSKMLHAVDKSDVAKIQGELRNRPIQANRAVKLVRRIFNYAIEMDDLAQGSNPTRTIKLFKEHPRERLMTEADMKNVGAAIHDLTRERPEALYAYKAIIFLFLTGCRKSEALRLRWEDIDFDHKILKFTQTKTDPRTHFISSQLAQFLEALDSKRFSEWVFPGRNPDRHLVDLKKSWDAVRDRTGLRGVRLHDVRHTVLSDIAASSDIQTAAFVGGHKSIRSTMRYIHSRSENTRNVMEKAASEKANLLIRSAKTED